MQRLSKILREIHLPAEKLSENEIASLAKEVLHNYRGNRALLRSVEKSLVPGKKYKSFLKFINSAKLGLIHEFGSLINKNPESSSILLGILTLGLQSGANIERNLESFHSTLMKRIELRNKVKSKVNGMQVITLLGLIFFFPLFSGIAASIASYSIASQSAKSYVSAAIRTLCIAYVSIILVITNSFIEPWKGVRSALFKALPFALFAAILQYGSYYFALNAI
ncbi:MAG: hypothetical protein KGH53_00840 [Candidatus Micrarchaeota archaeon]|nr:hypothetical protein [Candidatus Micrarchaeota archaeon]